MKKSNTKPANPSAIDLITELHEEISDKKSTDKKSTLFSIRFQDSTAREIEAEARLTRCTLSDVLRDRMIFGLTPEKDRDQHLRERRRFMPGIVEMSDDGLLERVAFLGGLIERAQSPMPFLGEELCLYKTEIALRKEGV